MQVFMFRSVGFIDEVVGEEFVIRKGDGLARSVGF